MYDASGAPPGEPADGYCPPRPLSTQPLPITTPDASIESADDARALPAEHPASRLRAVVVEYERRADRCTVHPRGMTADQRTTAWITADAVFYDLAEIR